MSYKSKPPQSASLAPGHPLAEGLVGCWLMNERAGRKVFDLSGRKNDGILNGDPSWAPGKFGWGLDLDGTGDYLDCGGMSETEGTDQLTIAFWFKPSIANMTDNGLISKYLVGASTPKYSWYLRLRWNSALTFRIVNSSGTNYDVVGGTPITDTNHWYHIVAVYTGSEIKYYVDGILDVTPAAASGNIADGNSNCWIGGYWSTSYLCQGKFDHVLIYNRALSNSEITRLYCDPFAMFSRSAGSDLMFSRLTNFVNAAGSASGQVSATGALTFAKDSPGILSEKLWLEDALFAGMTANAWKLGNTLSLGWFWMRTAGCSALYRGLATDSISFEDILAVADLNADSVSPPSYVSHDSDSTYFYVVRRFNQCGDQERTLAGAVKLPVDANGDLAAAEPNNVFSSTVEPADGDKVRLVWFYSVLEQQSEPACFNVYCDNRTGQIDYENPVTTITYEGRRFYSYQSGSLAAGGYLFAIRAEDADGIEESSSAPLRIELPSRNPQPIDVLSVEAV